MLFRSKSQGLKLKLLGFSGTVKAVPFQIVLKPRFDL
jgi:hypothetical protein